jgi:hypothetical protein
VTVRDDPANVTGKSGPGYNIAVAVDPPSVQRGQKATINYKITDPKSGKNVVNLPAFGGVTVHTTLVSQDMKWFQTGAATSAVGLSYPINLRFAEPGSYAMYAEFTSAYTPTERLIYTHTLSFGENVPSLEAPLTLQETTSTDQGNLFHGVAVRLDNGTPIAVGQPIVYHVKQPALFHYTLAESGQPVRDIAPLQGALGHLYIISADKEEFAHLYARESAALAQGAMPEPGAGGGTGASGGNPSGATETPAAQPTAPAASGAPNYGPELTFEHEFEKAGQYKVWLQFLYHGDIVTADYVVRVDP